MTTCFECDSPAEQDHHVVPRVLGGQRTVPLCGCGNGTPGSEGLW